MQFDNLYASCRITSAASDYLRIAHTIILSFYLSPSPSFSSSLSPYHLFPLAFTLSSLPPRRPTTFSHSLFLPILFFFFLPPYLSLSQLHFLTIFFISSFSPFHHSLTYYFDSSSIRLNIPRKK